MNYILNYVASQLITNIPEIVYIPVSSEYILENDSLGLGVRALQINWLTCGIHLYAVGTPTSVGR